MKKVRLLIMPLLVLPFVIGCNNVEKKNPRVTIDEFNSAVNFEGVTRIQVYGGESITFSGETITEEVRYETSELICHEYEKSDIQIEKYARIAEVGASECEYVEGLDGEWTIPEKGDSDDYAFTPDFYNPIKKAETILEADRFDPLLIYDNFNLTNDKYVYEGKGIVNGDDIPIKLKLKFENKILVHSYFSYEIYGPGEIIRIIEAEFSYQFEDIVPTWPIPDPEI